MESGKNFGGHRPSLDVFSGGYGDPLLGLLPMAGGAPRRLVVPFIRRRIPFRWGDKNCSRDLSAAEIAARAPRPVAAPTRQDRRDLWDVSGGVALMALKLRRAK